jgi:hypothetical protein
MKTGVRWLALLALVGCREVDVVPQPSASVERPPPDECNALDEAHCEHTATAACERSYYGGSGCLETHYLKCTHGHYAFCESDAECPAGSSCSAFLTPRCPQQPYFLSCNGAGDCGTNTLRSCLTPEEIQLVPHPANP